MNLRETLNLSEKGNTEKEIHDSRPVNVTEVVLSFFLFKFLKMSRRSKYSAE